MKMRTMKTWKRILAGVLAVMLMSTAGCGSSDGNAISATGDNASEAKAETTTEAGGGYGDGLVYLNQVFDCLLYTSGCFNSGPGTESDAGSSGTEKSDLYVYYTRSFSS